MKIDAPRFRISARTVEVLKTPEDFYRQLKHSITNAQTRIFLATLYIGAKEQELVDTLRSRLTENSSLKVHILSDGLRGTREFPKGPSTASLLSPLVSEFPGQVTVSMYKTPAFKGVAKLLPKRFNEGCGLQHMKLYGVDDEIVLSGANLSTDYFTNRQDRYIRIKDKRVTQHFWNIFEGVADLSWLLKSKGGTAADNFELVKPEASEPQKLRQLLNFKGDDILDTEGTYLYPLLGLYPYGFGNEKRVLTELCSSQHPYTLTAGYFNIAEPLKEALLKHKASGTIIVAAPEANGFYQSKGLSGNVPGLYSMLADKFEKDAKHAGAPISMLEWKKGVVNQPNGWSYHAKGLWLHGEDGLPFLTVIGSSNYTKRSYNHDIEAGAVITTTDSDLKRQLGAEIQHLQGNTCAMTSPEKPSLIQRAFVSIFGDRL